jgi:hypothetical protein
VSTIAAHCKTIVNTVAQLNESLGDTETSSCDIDVRSRRIFCAVSYLTISAQENFVELENALQALDDYDQHLETRSAITFHPYFIAHVRNPFVIEVYSHAIQSH